jgi:hypothetical protein
VLEEKMAELEMQAVLAAQMQLCLGHQVAKEGKAKEENEEGGGGGGKREASHLWKWAVGRTGRWWLTPQWVGAKAQATATDEAEEEEEGEGEEGEGKE